MGSLFDSNRTNDYDVTEVSIKSILNDYAADVTDEDRLKVDAKISAFNYSNNLIFEEMTGISRNSIISSSFTDIYNYSGSGLLFGYMANVEDVNNTYMRVLIDGNYVLFGSTGVLYGDLASNNIYDLQDIGSSTDFSGFALHDNALRVSYKQPILFNSNVTIQLRHATGGKRYRAGIINIAKD